MICDNGAHLRALDRIGGQQRRLGMHLVEIFDDRERLQQHLARRSSTSAGTRFCGLIARNSSLHCQPPLLRQVDRLLLGS